MVPRMFVDGAKACTWAEGGDGTTRLVRINRYVDVHWFLATANPMDSASAMDLATRNKRVLNVNTSMPNSIAHAMQNFMTVQLPKLLGTGEAVMTRAVLTTNPCQAQITTLQALCLRHA
jgi:hypothetical protein